MLASGAEISPPRGTAQQTPWDAGSRHGYSGEVGADVRSGGEEG